MLFSSLSPSDFKSGRKKKTNRLYVVDVQLDVHEYLV